jgi:hypothetical protein
MVKFSFLLTIFIWSMEFWFFTLNLTQTIQRYRPEGIKIDFSLK